MSASHTADSTIIEKARTWLSPAFDEATRKEVQHLLDHDPVGLTDAFYQDLEFGTGGLRGIMGAGSNKMNIYTVGMATQGLANYLLSVFPGQEVKVAIAHDSRINSPLFARHAARVLAANGIRVFLFEDLRPTPELSFAVRHLGCQSGIVVTASHNPKEYNGYKVYWNDGGQLIPPHDKNIIAEVRKISGPSLVKTQDKDTGIEWVGREIDEAYLREVTSLSLGQEGKEALKIIYTPLHGTGIRLIPEALQTMGFKQVEVLQEQAVPDGNFPTVHSPNPEESAALHLAIERAKATGADLVLGTDPDADRVGIAVRHKDELVLLNGNDTAAALIYYILLRKQELGQLKGNEFLAKTIVTTDLLTEIAQGFGVRSYECLTGFKYIAELIREKEGHEVYVAGGEESYGYLIGSFVRDKDAVSSAVMIAEAAAWAKSRGWSFADLLEQVHRRFHAYREDLISLTKKGKSGAEEIQQMMRDFRENCPAEINGSRVILTKDYQSSIQKDLLNSTETAILLPKSNVFQFVLEDQSVITARPSGTEPKIKFYLSVREKVNEDYERSLLNLKKRLEALREALKLN